MKTIYNIFKSLGNHIFTNVIRALQHCREECVWTARLIFVQQMSFIYIPLGKLKKWFSVPPCLILSIIM